MDAGPEAQKKFAAAIKGCKTILWNGPAGVFEFDNFCSGSRAIGEAIAEATAEGAFSLIGGGDSVACVNKFGLADKVSYISTGGGALLDIYSAGGQHINKTSSAVRITHLPTGIVTTSQAQRSQLQNRETAMNELRAKLFHLEEEKKRKQKQALKGDQKEIGWGSQIRSYVFHPYNLVKDLRTGYETADANGVMDGKLQPFIYSYLQWLLSQENPE